MMPASTEEAYSSPKNWKPKKPPAYSRAGISSGPGLLPRKSVLTVFVHTSTAANRNPAAIVSRFDDLISGTAEFTDVSSDHWAYKYIESDAAKGWITGYEDGTFRPEAYITRAEAVTLIDRALERVPDKSFIDNNIGDIKVFKDVKKEHWAYSWIIEATNGHDCSKDDINNEIWKNVIN